MAKELNIRTIEIARGSTHDGPGIRTTVFVKGCPLSCSWCQNPESINPHKEIWWEKNKCIRCLVCVDTCTYDAISADESGIHINREKCSGCEECVSQCPSGALQVVGEQWSMESLVHEVLKDKHYYDETGGGVTVSGGEPLMHAGFVEKFFKKLQFMGVNTALDTCGGASNGSLMKVLPYVDVVLFDIKFINPDKHKESTGSGNDRILENLLTIADYIRDARDKNHSKIHLWIRTPLIPDATATPNNISEIADFIHRFLSDVLDRWELCAFNTACISKYEKLEMPWPYGNYSLLKQKFADELRYVALEKGIDPEKLNITGIMSSEE